jgi:DNA-binding XRE family transcriptional regulator
MNTKKTLMRNNIDELIYKYMGTRMRISSKRVTVKDMEEDIAQYIGLSREGFKAIKKGNSNPSLPVAIKLAEYFNVKVEDIFFF